MSYRCGIGPGIGLEVGPPRIKCDGDGCDERIVIGEGKRPPAWFLDGKAAPKWQLIRDGEKRIDLCPDHRRRIGPQGRGHDVGRRWRRGSESTLSEVGGSLNGGVVYRDGMWRADAWARMYSNHKTEAAAKRAVEAWLTARAPQERKRAR